MYDGKELKEKVSELRDELKRSGLWKKNMPEWVTDYEKKEIDSHHDFAEWLQFVYIPNILEQTEITSTLDSKKYVALQAKKFFSEDVQKGKLLQLLIELDSLL
jgi:uncharacterized protein YqcC (DUF446 family)